MLIGCGLSKPDAVASEFLVLYDYGMGGLWAVVIANSADEILSRYPEVRIANERPAWMNHTMFDRLRSEAILLNVAADEGLFKAVVADRSK